MPDPTPERGAVYGTDDIDAQLRAAKLENDRLRKLHELKRLRSENERMKRGEGP